MKIGTKPFSFMKGNELATKNPEKTLKCHISMSRRKGNPFYAKIPGKMKVSISLIRSRKRSLEWQFEWNLIQAGSEASPEEGGLTIQQGFFFIKESRRRVHPLKACKRGVFLAPRP